MIVNKYSLQDLQAVHGIEMSEIEGTGVGAGWGRVAPGCSSEAQQHDETETLVVVSGSGTLLVDRKPCPVASGTVVTFEPFETHQISNDGNEDLVFATFYFREPERALQASRRPDRRGFGDRPVFVFSTPPTPNGDLHLGHLGGPYLGADVFVRFQRLNGTDAWHLTGSDDFQSYVVSCAVREGRTPAQTAADYSAEIAATLRLMDIEPDQYTVTSTDPSYSDGLRRFFTQLVNSGRVTVGPGRALFDGETGEYLYEGDVTGQCPGCAERTAGNICEECGEPNLVIDLREPRSALSSSAALVGEVNSFALPLADFRATVTARHGDGRVPARLKELATRVFARQDLRIPVTHPSSWGVPPAENAVDGQVIWVWPEMSYGFLHGIQALGRRIGKDWQAVAPQHDWKIVHFFGYDNSFYHAILYPVLYDLIYPGWQPDVDYHVNEFYLLDGEKFSTSRRHAIWGKEILGPDSVDAVRFYLARIRPEGRRTDFTLADYERVVADVLIGILQAWLSDLGGRVETQFGGVAPDAGLWTPEHTAFQARLAIRLAALTGSLDQDGFSLNRATDELMGIATDARTFARQESGLAGRADEVRTAIALELAAARLLAECAAPVMPQFSRRLAAALGLPAPSQWPARVTLVPAGTAVRLAGHTFFSHAAARGKAGDTGDTGDTAGEPLSGWLYGIVRATLQLPADSPLAGRSLAELGMTSMQAMAIQYQILDRTGREVPIEELSSTQVPVLAKLLGDPDGEEEAV